MQQLRMYWKPQATVWPQPPEGWSYRTYNGTQADAQAWLEICRNGLLQPQDGPEVFDACILSRPDFVPSALFFVERAGQPVATVTALLDQDGTGTLHMVGALPASRGCGVGGLLCRMGQASMWERGCRRAYLTTDDFRIPAVNSYLSAGFVPVEYDEGLAQRWTALLAQIGRTNVPFVREDGTSAGLLNPA